jgi:RNA polymerase sigma-70 factor (ECF subfamily)
MVSGTGDPSRDRGFREEALPQMDAVFRFALRLSGDPETAADLTQDTFLRAFQHWERYTPGTKAKSWLFTICRNLFLRRRERAQRHDQILSSIADEDPRNVSRESTVFQAVQARDPEGDFWAQVVDEEVLRAIGRLPPEFREAVILSDLEGFPYAEIAEVLDVPVGTVKSRLFRGRRLLQEALYEYAVSQGIIPDREVRE